jgi:methylated-DNA-[protein]-cysteine S-methyltransferase
MTVKSNHAFYESPIGTLKIISQENAIIQIMFVNENIAESVPQNKILQNCITQLHEYFNQKRYSFDINYNFDGTIFQQQVWNEVAKIPYGETASYLDIAKKTGNVMAVRAVGRANAVNPLPIIIPCHRIVGTSGKLVGYAGGLWRKKWLLKHENALLV